MAIQKRAYARYTLESIDLLGKMIRHGRKQRQMTEHELANRLGIARSTLQRVEQGEPKVAIGIKGAGYNFAISECESRPTYSFEKCIRPHF